MHQLSNKAASAHECFNAFEMFTEERTRVIYFFGLRSRFFRESMCACRANKRRQLRVTVTSPDFIAAMKCRTPIRALHARSHTADNLPLISCQKSL